MRMLYKVDYQGMSLLERLENDKIIVGIVYVKGESAWTCCCARYKIRRMAGLVEVTQVINI